MNEFVAEAKWLKLPINTLPPINKILPITDKSPVEQLRVPLDYVQSS